MLFVSVLKSYRLAKYMLSIKLAQFWNIIMLRAETVEVLLSVE